MVLSRHKTVKTKCPYLCNYVYAQSFAALDELGMQSRQHLPGLVTMVNPADLAVCWSTQCIVGAGGKMQSRC